MNVPMNKFLSVVLLTLFLISGFHSPGQEVVLRNIDGKVYIMHNVKAGETLYSIGAKYGVEAVTIINNNPGLISGLKAGDVLQIPYTGEGNVQFASGQQSDPDRFLIHNVQRRETLYSISRQYGITIDNILQYNLGLGQLRRGDVLRIPQWSKKDPDALTEQQIITDQPSQMQSFHVVLPGETLYSISRKFGTTLQVINELNPGVSTLKPGMKLRVPSPLSEGIAISLPEPEEYLQHTIVSGETLYSLTRKYNVTAEKLVQLNPVLEDSFRTGTVILIPVIKESPKNERFVYHAVKQGETLYSIGKNYHVSDEDMKEWNPYLIYRGIMTGDTLKIIPGDIEIRIPDEGLVSQSLSVNDCETISRMGSHGKQVHILMFLPLSVNSNNTMAGSIPGNPAIPDFNAVNALSDSVQIVRNERRPETRFQGNSENFIHFYEGALLAVGSLQQLGVKVRLTVIDTEQRGSVIRNMLSSGKYNDADLIVGPIYPAEQKEVAAFAEQMQIPMISPLSPSDEITRLNPWIFQVNPTREIVTTLTANHILDSYSQDNLLILRTGAQDSFLETELHRLAGEKFENANNVRTNIPVYDFKRSRIEGLVQYLVPDKTNVIILSATNEADVSVAVSNIHTLAPVYDIRLIGSNRFHQYESINQEYFHDGQLEFLAPYWPDYKSDVARLFIQNFRDYFKTEPNQYSIQGYDVTYFFGKAVADYGRDFRKCLNNSNSSLVQGNYFFVPHTAGGYINQGLSIVTFTKDYRVVKKGYIKKK
jgi:LysM repeat protein/ABC-type branched-subunit amino acid transport system substrate-binding protein